MPLAPGKPPDFVSMIGRDRETARIEQVLGRLGSGRGGSLVIRGEAGIGKTTLLQWARAAARDATVVATAGVESESELAFAALSDVLAPLLPSLDEVPPAQADALRSVLALGPSRRLDPLSVEAGALALLAASAPLLVLLDDAQWFDAASQAALLFAARRLESDAVVMLFAARDGDASAFAATGIPDVTLTGLARPSALELLRGRVSSPAVADELLAQTGGNPLALLELPNSLTSAQLEGAQPLERPLRVAAALERSFGRRVQLLGEETRLAVLVAATDDSGSAGIVLAAVEKLGLPAAALERAEDAALVRVERGSLQFAHPLIRSAVFHSAAPSERRLVHAALAQACADRDERRRAWHLAGATLAESGEAATALAAVGAESKRRGAFAEAAAAFERAARLAPQRGERIDLLVDAADAARLTGRPEHARSLIEEGLREDPGAPARGALLGSRAELALENGDQATAFRAFLEAAALVERPKAFELLVDAVGAAMQLDDSAIDEVIARIRALGAPDDPVVEFHVGLALGAATSIAGEARSVALIRGAVDIVERGDFPLDSPLRLMWAARGYFMAGRHDRALSYAHRAVEAARAGGAQAILVVALRLEASAGFDAGRWRDAYAAASEGIALAEVAGQRSHACASLGVLAEIDAAAGNRESCTEHARRALELATSAGLGFYRERAERALGQLELALGRPAEAVRRLEGVRARLRAARNLELNVTPVWDLIEAHSRLGRLEDARAVLTEVEAEPATPAESALFERARGLIESDFAHHFEAALALHDTAGATDPFPFERARVELSFGERLRRGGNRREARVHLRAALETFASIGAVAWAERAETELEASGARLQAVGDSRGHLTPRELQIAAAVAEGRSNNEVAASLFVTPKTVEFHLTRIYRKLGVRSRTELVRRLAERQTGDE